MVVLALVVSAQTRDSIVAQEPKPEPSPRQLSPPSLPPSVLEAELKSARRVRFKLSDYKGNVLVVTLWATWCGPCRFLTPALVRLQNEFRAKGVRVVELSTEDPAASARYVRDWMRRYKVNYRVGWSPAEISSALMGNNSAIPQMLVIARDGRILKRFIGYNKEQTERVMKQAIEQVLMEP
jgi:cytochrome c biogenesis protein CcmG/thiol:disulfide interchange protein DsbE